MDYKAMLIELLGLEPEATDEQIQTALTSTSETLGAVESAKKITEGLKSRVTELEGICAGRTADETMATLEKDGYAIASRENLREALIADHDRTVKSIRACKPTVAATAAAAPGADEPIRCRGTPPDGAGSDMKTKREEAIAAARKTNGIRTHAAAVARAQKDHPEYWKQ